MDPILPSFNMGNCMSVQLSEDEDDIVIYEDYSYCDVLSSDDSLSDDSSSDDSDAYSTANTEESYLTD